MTPTTSPVVTVARRTPLVLHRVQDVVAALPGLAIQRAEQARRPVLTGDGERTAIDTVVRAQRR
jgi:hypothetical protein